jgi:hypothetical protein
MTSHTAHYGFSFSSLSGVLHLPRRPQRELPSSTTWPAERSSDWLERLALWAERQPVHHRLGSYMLRR